MINESSLKEDLQKLSVGKDSLSNKRMIPSSSELFFKVPNNDNWTEDIGGDFYVLPPLERKFKRSNDIKGKSFESEDKELSSRR